MFQNKPILFLTDFSDYSRWAVGYGVALAKAYGVQLHVLHVIETRDSFRFGSQKSWSNFQEILHKRVTAQMHEFKLYIESSANFKNVYFHIVEGKALIKIIETVQSLDCGMIVQAFNGRTGLDQFVFGSVAERVVRHSTIPVLTVKSRERECISDSLQLNIKKILLPTDFSSQAEMAIPYSVSIAKKFGASLILLHVLEFPFVIPEFMPEIATSFSADVNEHAYQMLDRLKDSIKELEVETQLRTGIAYREICAAVAELNVDLLVIPKHGEGGLLHMLLGSVTEKVIRHADCPVLTLFPQEFVSRG